MSYANIVRIACQSPIWKKNAADSSCRKPADTVALSMGTVARNGNGCLRDAEKNTSRPGPARTEDRKCKSTVCNSTTLQGKCKPPIPWIGETD